MGTRSWITRELSDGSFDMRYCHWNGYLEGVGMGLVQCANTPKLVNWLFGLNRSFSGILSEKRPEDQRALKSKDAGGYFPWPKSSPAHQKTRVPVVSTHSLSDSYVGTFKNFQELWDGFENSDGEYLYVHRDGVWCWAFGPKANDMVPVETTVLLFELEQRAREGKGSDIQSEARAKTLWNAHTAGDQEKIERLVVERLNEQAENEQDTGSSLLLVAQWGRDELAQAVGDDRLSVGQAAAGGFKM